MIFSAIFLLAAILAAVAEHSDALFFSYCGIAIVAFACSRLFPRQTKRYGDKIAIVPDDVFKNVIKDALKDAKIDPVDDAIMPSSYEEAPVAPPEIAVEGPPMQREEEIVREEDIVHTYSLNGVPRLYHGMYNEVMHLGTTGPVKKLSQIVGIVNGYGRRNTMTSVGYDKRESNPKYAAVAFDFVEIGLRIPDKGYIKVEF